MGLTPLCGIPGATRAGDVDPSLIFHYTGEPLSRLSYDSATNKEIHITRVCSSSSYSFAYTDCNNLGRGDPQYSSRLEGLGWNY